jgi:hypothetical protein
MADTLRRFAGPGVLFLIPVGLEVSGIESLPLAVILWVVAGIWGIGALVTWPPVRGHLPIPDYRISVERIRPLPALSAEQGDKDTLGIDLLSRSQVHTSVNLPVATIETSLNPIHPLELSRVTMVLESHHGDVDYVDVVQQEKSYLENIFPIRLDRGGVYRWSFEIPPWGQESGECAAWLVFLADGKRFESPRFQVFREHHDLWSTP